MAAITCSYLKSITVTVPTAVPLLLKDEVCVWLLHLPAVSDEKMASLLSPAEIERAAVYRRQGDRSRFLKSRGLVRLLLAAYLNTSIADIIITGGINDKPVVNSHKQNIHFNISHSADLTAIAIANFPVGVDVEKIDTTYKYQDVLSLCFNEAETDFIESAGLPGFYKLWTIKEAIVKCTAMGLDNQLPNVPSLAGHYQVAEDITKQNLQVYSFEPLEGYLGGVAFASDAKQVKFFDSSKLLVAYT